MGPQTKGRPASLFLCWSALCSSSVVPVGSAVTEGIWRASAGMRAPIKQVNACYLIKEQLPGSVDPHTSTLFFPLFISLSLTLSYPCHSRRLSLAEEVTVHERQASRPFHESCTCAPFKLLLENTLCESLWNLLPIRPYPWLVLYLEMLWFKAWKAYVASHWGVRYSSPIR